MNFIKYYERLQRIHQLIRLQATGTPQQLASRLGISKRWVYEYINTLRYLGAQITYCPYSRSYKYTYNFNFELLKKSENNTTSEVLMH